jgi:hypothetical protein
MTELLNEQRIEASYVDGDCGAQDWGEDKERNADQINGKKNGQRKKFWEELIA